MNTQCWLMILRLTITCQRCSNVLCKFSFPMSRLVETLDPGKSFNANSFQFYALKQEFSEFWLMVLNMVYFSSYLGWWSKVPLRFQDVGDRQLAEFLEELMAQGFFSRWPDHRQNRWWSVFFRIWNDLDSHHRFFFSRSRTLSSVGNCWIVGMYPLV